MTTRVDARRMLTPMFLVLLAIGTTDLLFTRGTRAAAAHPPILDRDRRP